MRHGDPRIFLDGPLGKSIFDDVDEAIMRLSVRLEESGVSVTVAYREHYDGSLSRKFFVAMIQLGASQKKYVWHCLGPLDERHVALGRRLVALPVRSNHPEEFIHLFRNTFNLAPSISIPAFLQRGSVPVLQRMRATAKAMGVKMCRAARLGPFLQWSDLDECSLYHLALELDVMCYAKP